MPIHESCRIHPTAIISPLAELGPEVQVGPFAIIEGSVTVGAGSIIHARAHLIGSLTLGCRNQVFENTVLGGKPQHFTYANEPTSVEIGDDNIFRENVTVNRGTTSSYVTRIGNKNYFMCGSHVGHDCVVGNHCILVNGALLGGHVTMMDHAYMSGNTGVHQHCRLGRFSFLSGTSATTKDIPPFIMQQETNVVVGVNIVGMRRGSCTSEQISAIRRLYHIVYLQGMSLPNALSRVEKEMGHIDVVAEFVQFARSSKRGINGTRTEHMELAA
jgi:UDP-N-acetylglucosamine acyltransferase